MISICIFSKDRACQLELLLTSIKKFMLGWESQNIGVIYKASTEEFDLGYKRVQEKHKEFKFINETVFRNDVLSFFKVSHKLVMFLVDDDIFVAPFNPRSNEVTAFYNNQSILTLSLRMHPKVTYCYTTRTVATPPPLSNGNVWNWKTAQPNTDWSYPMSVDGHIFRAQDILPLVFNTNYHHPNTFEGALAVSAPHHKPFMMCFNIPIIVNNPANKVQNINSNFAGLEHGFPASELNKLFIAGKTISLEKTLGNLKGLNAPHVEFPYEID